MEHNDYGLVSIYDDNQPVGIMAIESYAYLSGPPTLDSIKYFAKESRDTQVRRKLIYPSLSERIKMIRSGKRNVNRN